jgi:hypothetical protein
MFRKTLVVLTTLTILTGVPANAETLRGDAFITAMDGNTLFGKDADGTLFKIYFLPGGQVTIQQGSAHPKYGHWDIDERGDVCVKWVTQVIADSGCFRVDLDGNKMTWFNKDGTHTGGLLGSVAPLETRKTE